MNRDIRFLILAILEIYNLNRVISHSAFSFLRIFIFAQTVIQAKVSECRRTFFHILVTLEYERWTEI